MNLLHPVYHGHAYQAGSRIDIEEPLPVNLKSVEMEELLENMSEPPLYVERLSPVGTQIGNSIVRGKNWAELVIKGYRVIGKIFEEITRDVRQSIMDNFDQKGMVPFLSLDIDPDTLQRVVEYDYESGENTYGKLMQVYESGVLAPTVTIPFHIILPTLGSDYDVRMVIRMGIHFYWDILKSYHKFLEEAHKEKKFIVSFWLPEGGFNHKILKILHDEFMTKAKAEGYQDPHLVILLDNYQAVDKDNDVLMKSWNIIRVGENPNDYISALFRDRKFSDWVTFSNPSVKKLIDRTIAKSDADLNAMNVDYCWSHFEDIEALAYTHKAALNFQQKITKLIELQYLPVSPDFFIRRKINGRFGRSLWEPQEVVVKDDTSWRDWHQDKISFGRWEGFQDSNAEVKVVDDDHPYKRLTPKGDIEEKGHQCWKIAFNKVRSICREAVRGNAQEYDSGILGVLASLVPSKKKEIIKRNVDNFLIEYSCIIWKHHFVHHGLEEADLTIEYIVEKNLCEDTKGSLKDEEIVIAAAAAQAYYYLMDSHKSYATFWENMDQRSTYQNVIMLSLSMINLIYIYHWKGEKKQADKIYNLLKDELLNFESAFERYNLEQYGVKQSQWKAAIKSHVNESKLNVVERAARRIAAVHLRPLGYTKDLTKDDEALTTNTGHIWTGEVENTNFKWENPYFCGIQEV